MYIYIYIYTHVYKWTHAYPGVSVVSERPNSSMTQWLQAIEAEDSVKPSQVKTDQGHLMKATSTSSKSNKNPSSSNPTIERVGA